MHIILYKYSIMSCILHIETSTEACSVAVSEDGLAVMSLLQRISSGLGGELQILRQLQITATFAQYSQDMMIQRVLLLMM